MTANNDYSNSCSCVLGTFHVFAKAKLCIMQPLLWEVALMPQALAYVLRA